MPQMGCIRLTHSVLSPPQNPPQNFPISPSRPSSRLAPQLKHISRNTHPLSQKAARCLNVKRTGPTEWAVGPNPTREEKLMILVHSQKLSQKLIEEQALLIQKLQAELVKWRERAERDALSGCLRRESFMELIETRRSFGLLNAETTLVIIDIDHFKKVNDTHGHLAGDEALKHIARLLKERLPEGALLCRMGGEEFAMLLNGNVESNRSYLESLRIQIAQTPAKIANGKRLSLTASFGAVTWKTHTAFVNAAADADLLLYKAKNQGRNRIAA